MATDEEVETRRKRVDELRARVQDAKQGGGTTHNELANDIAVAQLDAEEASLQAELDELERVNDPARLVAASTPLATAREQMVAAVKRQEAAAEAAAAQDAAVGKATAPPEPKAVDKTTTTNKATTEKAEG